MSLARRGQAENGADVLAVFKDPIVRPIHEGGAVAVHAALWQPDGELVIDDTVLRRPVASVALLPYARNAHAKDPSEELVPCDVIRGVVQLGEICPEEGYIFERQVFHTMAFHDLRVRRARRQAYAHVAEWLSMAVQNSRLPVVSIGLGDRFI